MNLRNIQYLEMLLSNAVRREDYEQAAVLRDRIKEVREKEEPIVGDMTIRFENGSTIRLPDAPDRPSAEEQRRTKDLEKHMDFKIRHELHGTFGAQVRRMDAAGEVARQAGERLREAMERMKNELEQALREQMARCFPDVELDYYTMRGQGFTVNDTRAHHVEYHFRGRMLLYVDYNYMPPVIVQM